MGQGRTDKRNRYSLRHARAADTRATILRAAADLFAESGLSGARTEAIARAARVNKALIYYYFKSKEGLYSVVLEHHFREFSSRALELLAEPISARAKVLRYVSMQFDFISARPHYPPLLQHLMMTRGRQLERLARDYFLPLSRRVTSVIKEGVQRGEFRHVDANHMAISLVGVTVHYFASAPIVRALRGIEPYDARQLRRRKKEVLDFIRFGLFRKPKGASS